MPEQSFADTGAGMRARSLGRTQESTLFPRRLASAAVALSLVVLPAPPAAAHITPVATTQTAYLLQPDPAAATRVAAERAARSFTRRMTPAATVPAAVKVKPPVVKKPAVKVVKPVVKRQAPKKTTVEKAPVVVPGSVSAVIQFLYAQVGKPYVWGAAGPGSFDCSGLTQAAYRRAGVTLPHQSGAQAHVGRAVSRSQLRAGDLIVYSGHVGIAVSATTMIHAANPSKGVVKSTIYGSPIGYRRIVG